MATRGFAILRGGVSDAADTAATAESLGYHSAWSPEFYTRSAIVSLAAMAQATTTIRIGSSIAYAVGRTPLVLATEARSLDELSGGRLALGLGTGTTRMMADWHGIDPAGHLHHAGVHPGREQRDPVADGSGHLRCRR